VAEAAQLAPEDVLLDLYCGTGTIGLSLARDCAQVVGFEVSAAAVEDANVNAALNGIFNASFVLGDVQEVFRELLAQKQGAAGAGGQGGRAGRGGKGGRGGRGGRGAAAGSPAEALRPDVIVADPARAGMSSAAVAFVRAAQPRRLVYVSCNAATLARDVEALCRQPGPAMRLVSLQPVDMFPHTDHVEVVAVLERER
jgi:23S rRNA (uracil1939-C5)-methyltransferase